MAIFYKGNIPVIETDLPATNLSHPKDVKFGHVPRDYTVYPEMMFAPPSEMELVLPSDFDARYDEQEEQQSSLEHIYLSGPGGTPAFVNLDQNGDGYCVTADSEYLTNAGWVSVSDYDGTAPVATVDPSTNQMEFQYPSIVHRYEYSGEMIYSTNRRIDFGVTPNHRMYVRKWDEKKRTLSNDYGFVQAKDIGWYAGLLAAPIAQIGTHIEELAVPGFSAFSGDDFFALLGLIVSDGFAGGAEKNQNVVSFASFRGISDIAELALRCGFRRKASNENVWVTTSHPFANWIRENCYCSSELGSANKKVPLLVKAATPRQIRIFLHYFDDRNRSGSDYYSGSKQLIDDLQELHLRIGIRSSIGKREPRSSVFAGNASGMIHSRLPQYTLHVSSTDSLCIDKKKHIEQDKYKGEVFCVTVPNGTIVTRRNGSVLISGNCWSYSTGQSMMMDRLRRNLPLKRLNPHGPAAIIKGGRDEGGWCGLSAKWARENGYPEEGTGPGQWALQSRNLKYDTPACRAEMAKNKVEEEWTDMTRQVYDQNLTMAQVATCGFNNIPGPGDYNWWSHSVCRIRWVRVEKNAWGQLILNSWKNWGRHGLAVLLGSKAVCNGGLAIRLTSS